MLKTRVFPQIQCNLKDLDKVSDIVKSLLDFSGDPAKFGSLRNSVDTILKTYAHTIGTVNKIKGNADVALDSYNGQLSPSA